MIKASCETAQLSFRLSVNAEDIHLGPVVNGEGLTHGPLADQLALGFVHDPGQRDLGRGDAPVGAADLQGGKATVHHIGAVRHGSSLVWSNQRGKAAEVIPPIGSFQVDHLLEHCADLSDIRIHTRHSEVKALPIGIRHDLKTRQL